MKKEKIYYSQVRQDEFLHKKIFKNFRGGIFLDLGAYDGKTLSNTYFFEKNLGWKGFCFEPIPEAFNELVENRNCKCYNLCIGDKKGIVEFSYFPDSPMLSGISKNLNPEDMKRESIKNSKPQTIKSKVVSIENFLSKEKIKEIHLLSLDIEGNEEKVIKSIDFEKTFIHAICLEDNYNEKKLDSFLKNKDFVLIKHAGFDKIFVNRKSKFYSRGLFFLELKANLINLFYNRFFQRIFREELGRFPRTKKLLKRILEV
jgi:FkbM family methyltransferase